MPKKCKSGGFELRQECQRNAKARALGFGKNAEEMQKQDLQPPSSDVTEQGFGKNAEEMQKQGIWASSSDTREQGFGKNAEEVQKQGFGLRAAI
ncbi:MAG: hypothetical protein KBT04_00910 [Bacteroidales bacterium]|nr:hypothetical protein [Candidatus Colimorpha onthohippi]